MEEVIFQKRSLYKTKYTGDLNSLDKQINHLAEFDKGRKETNIGGYQSNFINFGFDELLTFVFNTAKHTPLLQDKNFRLGGFWLNINKGSDYNETHVHSMNVVSAVYYHKICCNESPIVFTNHTPYIQKHFFKFVPSNQDIIFFDGLEPHYVEPCNQKEHTRISIAFNLLLE